MRVLVIGGGGREHALVWKIAQSPHVTKIFCAPGNAGIAEQAECVAVSADSVDDLLAFAKKEHIDLTVVGPEAPLVAGAVDHFYDAGLPIIGPTARAAQIEGSKAFSKDLMVRAGVPTATHRAFTDYQDASQYLDDHPGPCVIKASGLAAGKGVILADTVVDAHNALDRIMRDKTFGDAGAEVVIEDLLRGEEASFIALADGEHVLPLASSQDHKPIYDGDAGPNTGGMGAYSPAPVVTPDIHDIVMRDIMERTVRQMADDDLPFAGVLYAGLMIENGAPQTLEFNARFGDPECQPLLMRLKTDIMDVFDAMLAKKLDTITLDWDDRPAVCVVLASEGYPGSYAKGREITGLDDAGKLKDVIVFHAGTANKDGAIVTNGGRVLGVTARGDDIAHAIDRAYDAVKRIKWDGMYYRTDIGKKALNR